MPDENMTVPTGHEPATPASVWKPDLVIFHGKCADGIVAAWACWKRWGDEPEYRAANYGYEPPADVGGKNILIVDFSYLADDLRGMVAAGCKSIVILDHHKTAQEALHEFAVGDYRETGSVDDVAAILDDLEQFAFDPVVPFFDMKRSGARMAWDFAHPAADTPRLVELAERYDLWRFQPGTLDHAELLHLVIQAGEMTIPRMDRLADDLSDGDGPLIEGAAILDWRTQLVAEIASRAHLRTVAGVEGVISVECPYSLVSAVGHHLLDKHPDTPFAAMSVTGEKAVTWSLRSHDDRSDVSALAKSMGGGGHRNAAGFRVEHPAPAPSPETKTMTEQKLKATYEARYCPGMPTDCCDYGVISHETGKEVCRVWDRDDAERIRDLLNTSHPTPAADEMEAATKPWADFNGDLPEYDHPMRCVYESGIQYAVNLLAKFLKVEDYEVCDGTEEFDGDLGGTMFNIVLGAMPKDEHGDPMHPSDLRAAIAAMQARSAATNSAEGRASTFAACPQEKPNREAASRPSAEPAGEEPVAWDDLGAERYVRDFIIHGEVSTRRLEPWEQSHQDAGHIDMAERRGYIHVGRDVSCTITVTDHGRRIAALLNRPATPSNPERLAANEKQWTAVIAEYVSRHKRRTGFPSWSALPGYLAALSAAQDHGVEAKYRLMPDLYDGERS